MSELWIPRAKSVTCGKRSSTVCDTLTATHPLEHCCDRMSNFNIEAHESPRKKVMTAFVTTLQNLPTQPDVVCPRPLASRSIYLLFFDGGLRGNPGPGGSRLVIVRLDIDSHAADICWVASMSSASKATTNNTAEYWGLLHRLRSAADAELSPLHVIGDSSMIIQQQRMHRAPENPRLRKLYLRAKRCAAGLGIRSWSHHYREFNKMAIERLTSRWTQRSRSRRQRRTSDRSSRSSSNTSTTTFGSGSQRTPQ